MSSFFTFRRRGRRSKFGVDGDGDESIDVNAAEGEDNNNDDNEALSTINGGKKTTTAGDDDDESVNSDGEDADPDGAKAGHVGEDDYAGDQDDEEIEHEFDREQNALEEGDELIDEDKGRPAFACCMCSEYFLAF